MNPGLAADKPDHERQDDRDDDAGRDRKVQKSIFGFDANVARQTAEAQLGEPRPEKADDQDCRPDGYQNTLHIDIVLERVNPEKSS